MTIYYLVKLFTIWIYFMLVTLAFSLLVSLTSNYIFKSANKKVRNSYIPMYNLLVLLDIVNINYWYMFLFIVPGFNILLMIVILYRLGVIYNLSFAYSLSLILFPFILLFHLNYVKVKEIVKNQSKNNQIVEEISLFTNSQIEELNNEKPTEEKVDNVFKSEVKNEEKVETFKANQIKYKEILLNDNKKSEERIENIKLEKIKDNKIVSIDKKEEDDSIEIIEL